MKPIGFSGPAAALATWSAAWLPSPRYPAYAPTCTAALLRAATRGTFDAAGVEGALRVDVTELIAQARAGDAAASGRLFSEVYADLRMLAARQVGRMRADMRATSLVHEAWFRLAKPEALQLKDREHFFAVAARAMRQLVIDHARQRIAGKRGGGAIAAELDSQLADAGSDGRDQELLALDQSLRQLEALDAHLALLVEMRFFGGLELSEIAALTARSERSLKRDWRKARAFLHQQLGGETLPADD